MPLLLNLSMDTESEANTTAIVSDAWISLSDNDELSDDVTHTIVSLSRYIELAAEKTSMPGGLMLSPADDVKLVTPFVDQLKLICIDFPIYTDGRGYSHARVLRKRLNFSGEIRAVGDIRADQLLFMQRTGIDTYLFKEMPDEALIANLTSRFKNNYQPSYPLLT